MLFHCTHTVKFIRTSLHDTALHNLTLLNSTLCLYALFTYTYWFDGSRDATRQLSLSSSLSMMITLALSFSPLLALALEHTNAPVHPLFSLSCSFDSPVSLSLSSHSLSSSPPIFLTRSHVTRLSLVSPCICRECAPFFSVSSYVSFLLMCVFLMLLTCHVSSFNRPSTLIFLFLFSFVLLCLLRTPFTDCYRC